MSREEEIIREIKSLNKKIEELRNEYNNIKNADIIRVGDFYKELKVNPTYYKIVEIVNSDCIIAVRVVDSAIEQYLLTCKDLIGKDIVKCSQKEFESMYESILQGINRIKPITK